MADQLWDIRGVDGGATGLPFSLARIEEQTVVLAHALPSTINVEVRTEGGDLIAKGTELEHSVESPMARLTISGRNVRRENIWPTEQDEHLVVILAGGEAGLLEKWSNDDAQTEWTWTVKFHNHK